jgi:hypothetical protein
MSGWNFASAQLPLTQLKPEEKTHSKAADERDNRNQPNKPRSRLTSPAKPAADRTPQRAKVDAYDVTCPKIEQRGDEDAYHDKENFGDFLKGETNHKAADRAQPQLINNRR